jgi:GDP-L-fucose synthase
MVRAALVRRLASERCEVVTADRRTLDLTRQADRKIGFATTGRTSSRLLPHESAA